MTTYQWAQAGVILAASILGLALPITPLAVAAGRRLAERLFNGQVDGRVDYSNIPSVVFSQRSWFAHHR